MDCGQIPNPSILIKATSCSDKIHRAMVCSYITPATFLCPTYNTGTIWDTGYCLGYVIFALPKDIKVLAPYKGFLSQLSHSIASSFYSKYDLRPYGTVEISPYSQIERLLHYEQANFLQSCFSLTS